MLIALAYCRKDQAQAASLANWLDELGPFPGHHFLIARDAKADPMVFIGHKNLPIFNEIVIKDDTTDKWPESANHAFKRIGKHVQHALGAQAFLYIEPDAVILRASAFDEIEAEYQQALAAGKLFLGQVIDQRGIGIDSPPHMSGIGVYPAELVQHAGIIYQADNVPFDIVAGPQIIPRMMKSELIYHNWKGSPFESWADVERRIFAVRPKCAVYHSDKQNSLIGLLRERLQKPPEIEAPKERRPRGENGINDGPCSVEGCEKPAAMTGVCRMHYARRETHGSFDLPPRPSLREKMMLNRMVVDNGCWLWTAGTVPSGYGEINVEVPGGKSYQSVVHRISYQEFVGPIPDGLLVCHKCDVKLCFNPEHLFLGTDADNMRDAAEKGRLPHGESHSWATLTEENVRAIRTEYAAGEISQGALAERYGCSQGNIYQIVNNKTWKLEARAQQEETATPQTPWASKPDSIAEIRQLAARLMQFSDSSPHVRLVRAELHDAGVIQLAYRYKKRGGWKRKKGKT